MSLPRKNLRLPTWIAPQLATLVDAAPASTDWIHETKFDGYRILARRSGREVQLFSRNQKTYTHKFPDIVSSLLKLSCKEVFLDGEITVLDANGHSRFQLLQNALKGEINPPLVLYLFDLLFVDGEDLRELPLLERKNRLEKLLKPLRKSANVRFSGHIVGNGPKIYKAACSMRFEGIICKAAQAPYLSGRTKTWLKCKCTGREEFLIVGFTQHSKHSKQIGALLLGTRKAKGGGIQYRGKVGTGFSDKLRRELFASLTCLVKGSPTVDSAPRLRGVTWVKPKKIAEIEFTEKTQGGLLRHSVFLGVREDKAARDVVEERKMKLV